MKRTAIIIFWAFFTSLCFGQTGFRKALPFKKLTFEKINEIKTFDDLIVYQTTSIDSSEKIIYSCKTNEFGEVVESSKRSFYARNLDQLILSKNDFDKRQNLNESTIYYFIDSLGYRKQTMIQKNLMTFNKSGNLTKREVFVFSEKRNYTPEGFEKIKPPPPDTTIENNDTIIKQYLFRKDFGLNEGVDYNATKGWEQVCLWIYKYRKNSLMEQLEIDLANQKIRQEFFYNQNGKLDSIYGYRNFYPNAPKSEEITDSLTSKTFYTHFENFISTFTKHTGFTDYHYVDTVFMNDKGQKIKYLLYYRYSEGNLKDINSINYEKKHELTYEYDFLDRISKMLFVSGTQEEPYTETLTFKYKENIKPKINIDQFEY